jgi:hypothetical protein
MLLKNGVVTVKIAQNKISQYRYLNSFLSFVGLPIYPFYFWAIKIAL